MLIFGRGIGGQRKTVVGNFCSESSIPARRDRVKLDRYAVLCAASVCWKVMVDGVRMEVEGRTRLRELEVSKTTKKEQIQI